MKYFLPLHIISYLKMKLNVISMTHISLDKISTMDVPRLEIWFNSSNKTYIIIGQTKYKRHHIAFVRSEWLRIPNYIGWTPWSFQYFPS